MTDDDARALGLYQLAQSVVDAKGWLVTVGFLTYKEYMQLGLSIRYLPRTAHLEVWHKRKVLMVESQRGSLNARLYVPGEWERLLEDAAR